jgi:hypothetical protein
LSNSRIQLIAPLTAAVLIAQQVGSNAARDALFLSSYPVTTLPYFVAGAAIIALPAAQGSGRLLLRFGPTRVVPAFLSLSAVLFIIEWLLLGQPRVAAVLLYMHSSVLGAIAISAFWSLLNERFDPHSAKALMAQVAGAATFGGLIGGIGAERVAALLSSNALLPALGVLGALSVSGALIIIRGARTDVPVKEDHEESRGAWTELRKVPLLRNLALVTAFGALMASLVDYLLKAEAVAWLGGGKPLVRFFGLFYAATGIGAFILQATIGRVVLSRLGLGGSVAAHPAVVGAAGMLGFIVPAPWGGIFPRALDMTLRNSVARAGYELLYTPLPQAAKRAAKSVIDVTCDSVGKGVGAVVIMLLTRLGPVHALFAVNLAGVFAAALDVVVARQLRASYVMELEGGLRRQSGEFYQAAQQSLSDFTMVGTLVGMDQDAIRRALGEQVTSAPALQDPVVAAMGELRSGDTNRIRAALQTLPRDPALIGALVPLLANGHVLHPVVDALESFGPRAAGEMVSALLDSATPETVQRRLPMVLKSCESALARDGLMSALESPNLQVRLRATRALLSLTEKYPALSVPGAAALAAAERQLQSDEDSQQIREYVFNLFALSLEREPMRIAAQAFETDDLYVRGTSLEYLETVLPSALFSALRPRLSSVAPAATRPRAAAEVRKDLMKAGATMTMSLADVQRHLASLNQEEEGGTEE